MSEKATEPDSLNNTNPDMIFALHAAAMRETSEPRDGISPVHVSYIVPTDRGRALIAFLKRLNQSFPFPEANQ